MLKIYDPAQEKNQMLIKGAIVAAVGGLLGLVVGRWLGKRSERKAQERQRERMDWSDRKMKRRLHARDWKITLR
jgi:membrane protein YqaA with SNARE-associated domain